MPLRTAKDWGGTAPEMPDHPISAPDFGLFGDLQWTVWGDAGAPTAGMIVFTLVLAGFFDAMAPIIGVGSEAGPTDDKGRMPGLSKALFIDGAGGMIGGVAGTCGQTVFVESATGVGEGACTGLLFACGVSSSPRWPRSCPVRSRPPRSW